MFHNGGRYLRGKRERLHAETDMFDLCVCQCVQISVPICLSEQVSVSVYICLSQYMYLSACLSVQISVFCLFVCPSKYMCPSVVVIVCDSVR